MSRKRRHRQRSILLLPVLVSATLVSATEAGGAAESRIADSSQPYASVRGDWGDARDREGHVDSDAVTTLRSGIREDEQGGVGPLHQWGEQEEDARRRRRADDAAAGDDGGDADGDKSTDEQCADYLISFLQGTTDARDDCDGIMNAYLGADCGAENAQVQDDDDYFFRNGFNNLDCCQTLRTHYSQYCSESDLMRPENLLLITGVMLLCEFAKTVVRKHDVKFLPEAAVCILVGTVCGIVSLFVYEGFSVDEVSFNAELFLNILLPPIIFEAALSVNKKEFIRRRFPIFMFAVFGTIISTFITGFMVYYITTAAPKVDGLPILDSLVFGALISSIDPVAILSVLSSLGMTETDTIFILVFGESLLNDGVAITMFNALVGKYAGGGDISSTTQDEILGAVADFLIVGFGSMAIGLAAGVLALVYFYVLHGHLQPVMEVGSFFLWALVPYYICDIVGWSGIVGIVVMGFFMDVFIAAPKGGPDSWDISDDYIQFEDDSMLSVVPDRDAMMQTYGEMQKSMRHVYLSTFEMTRPLFGSKRVRLSKEADRHVRFVAHLMAQIAENSIFVYLGLFLFSNKYDWDILYIVIGIASCVLARAAMVVLVSWAVWHIHILRQRFWYSDAGKDELTSIHDSSCGCGNRNIRISRSARHIADKKTQLVLVMAGLRGAISLCLVENVPIYNGVTGEGTMYKPTLKAMTSASIMFTTFVFGGGAYYILRGLGIQSDREVRVLGALAGGQELSTGVGRKNSGSTSSLVSVDDALPPTSIGVQT